MLKRRFKPDEAGKVLLTDITYLTYKGNKGAYLSTIKDAETNEILAYEVSSSLSIEITLNTLRKLKKHRHLTQDALIHSDHDRRQWNLKKLPPVKYSQQLNKLPSFFFKMSFTKGTL